jgi:hypothetical protein
VARIPQRQRARQTAAQPSVPRKKGVSHVAERELKKSQRPIDPYVTMVFDSDEDYVRFTDYAYEAFGPGSLDFTDIPILTSIRVRRDVLAQTQETFGMHEFGEQDQALIEELPTPKKWPFDAALIRQTPIPGVPEKPPEKQP